MSKSELKGIREALDSQEWNRAIFLIEQAEQVINCVLISTEC